MKQFLIKSRQRAVAIVAALSLLPSIASAVPVDLELSLVIDVSGSVSTAEYNLQMDGYANAFRDGAIQSNILDTTGGNVGAIAVNAVFFASSAFTSALDSFVLLNSASSINSFADLLDGFVRPGSGGTAVNAGMSKAIDLLLADNGFESTNRVIDVSGDGTSSTTTTAAQRDRAAAEGITVNGLAIENSTDSTLITDFYRDWVITSDGFVVTASGFDQFDAAVRRKLAIETGGDGTVPEPGMLGLLGLGLIGLRWVRRRSV